MENQFFIVTKNEDENIITLKFVDTCQKIDAKNYESIQNSAIEFLKKCREDSNFIFDLDNVIYVSSAGLRMFSSVNKVAQELNVDYKLINLRKDILKLFQLTGYASIFKIEEKVEFN